LWRLLRHRLVTASSPSRGLKRPSKFDDQNDVAVAAGEGAAFGMVQAQAGQMGTDSVYLTHWADSYNRSVAS
jgi:hypothetical protein